MIFEVENSKIIDITSLEKTQQNMYYRRGSLE